MNSPTIMGIRKGLQVALRPWRTALWHISLTAILTINSPAIAQQAGGSCGSLGNAYGPFDYRTERDNKLKIVESYHFSPGVEALIKGDSGSVGQDLDYTLRASPNHHRALMAMARLGVKLNIPQPHGAHYSVECYFQRAIQFRPDDNTARLIYASFLVTNKRAPEATSQLEIAASNTEEPFTHYNIGLIYFDLKSYDKALEHAHKALILGFLKPELREQLQSVGKWTEPAPTTATPPSAAASVPDTQTK